MWHEEPRPQPCRRPTHARTHAHATHRVKSQARPELWCLLARSALFRDLAKGLWDLSLTDRDQFRGLTNHGPTHGRLKRGDRHSDRERSPPRRLSRRRYVPRLIRYSPCHQVAMRHSQDISISSFDPMISLYIHLYHSISWAHIYVFEYKYHGISCDIM